MSPALASVSAATSWYQGASAPAAPRQLTLEDDAGGAAAPADHPTAGAGSGSAAADPGATGSTGTTGNARKAGADPNTLTADQQREVAELQRRDLDVRAHEAAHEAVGGSLVGGVHFTYQTGPDHKRYAVGGDVSIDAGTESTPAATIAKMEQVRAAALAPADPSSQDLSVAAMADAAIATAEADQAQARAAQDGASTQATGGGGGGGSGNGSGSGDVGSGSQGTGSTTTQKRATAGYSLAIATIISQITGSGIDATA